MVCYIRCLVVHSPTGPMPLRYSQYTPSTVTKKAHVFHTFLFSGASKQARCRCKCRYARSQLGISSPPPSSPAASARRCCRIFAWCDQHLSKLNVGVGAGPSQASSGFFTASSLPMLLAVIFCPSSLLARRELGEGQVLPNLPRPKVDADQRRFLELPFSFLHPSTKARNSRPGGFKGRGGWGLDVGGGVR